MELLQKLGIDGKLLLAQVINFLVLAFVLYKLAYRPLLKVLDKRSKTIARSLADAKRVEEQLKASKEERDRLFAETQRANETLMAQAHQQAEQLRHSMLAETKTELDALRARTQQEVGAMKARVLDEAKGELADLVVAASAKVLGEKVTTEKDRVLAEAALKDLTQ